MASALVKLVACALPTACSRHNTRSRYWTPRTMLCMGWAHHFQLTSPPSTQLQ